MYWKKLLGVNHSQKPTVSCGATLLPENILSRQDNVKLTAENLPNIYQNFSVSNENNAF